MVARRRLKRELFLKKPPAAPISIGKARAAFERDFLELAHTVIAVEQGTQAASDISDAAPNTEALTKSKARTRIRIQSLASLKNKTESGLILKPEESADA